MTSQHGNVAVIVISNPPVNVLSSAVARHLVSQVQSAVAEPSVSAIVLIGEGNTFIAGADIRELAQIAAGEQGPLQLLSYLQAIEDSPKPVIAAIHGAALGGGLELAMAAHYRLITSDAKVGLPEVKLGLIPGAGGTQRLPRLVGLAAAAKLCATGEPINAQTALSMGLVDRIVEGDLLAAALSFASQMADQPFTRTSDRPVTKETLPDIANPRDLPAPLRALEAIRACAILPFAAGCAVEASLFEQSLQSSESKALIYGFFGERTANKIPGSAKPLPIEKAAVIGAGTMGTGIAIVFALAGIPVLLKDTSAAALHRAMESIRRLHERKRITQEALALVHPQLDWNRCETSDIIVEAVFEDLQAKRQAFAEMDGIAKPGCILASNTSSLDLDQIAQVTRRPEMVVGTHFFSPANVMRLLEVVRGAASSDQVVSTAMALGKRLGKTTVLARNSPGFIGNRVFFPYLRQARLLVEEGASVEQVNAALYDWGMAMGPLAVDDLTGLDVSVQIENQLSKPGMRKPRLTEALLRAGRLGQKSGFGWSKYDDARKPSPDPEVAALVDQFASDRRTIQADEIVERCIFALINEGAKVLEEGVALRPVDIDTTFLKGFGFPSWRGGPMFYADSIGLAKVLEGVMLFDEPASLLRTLAESGKTFQQQFGRAV